MRKALRVLVTGFFLVGAAGQARAVALSFVGSLALEAGLPVHNSGAVLAQGFGPALVNGSGPGGHITSLGLPGGRFVAPTDLSTLTGFTTPSSLVRGVKVTSASNASGAFGGAPLGGVMPLHGTAKLCIFDACPDAVVNLTVPLSVVGAGGSVALTPPTAPALTVIGAPWTTGTAAVGTLTEMGFAKPASDTGSPSGRMSLVTPIVVRSIGIDFPMFAILEFHFVPEPGTLLMLGAGVAGLVAYGRRSGGRG